MEYITITEFAEKAGVTPQAVYKRIKTDLEPFVKVENGVKLIEEEALNLFKVAQQTKEKQRAKELEERIAELEKLNETLKNENFGLMERLAANSEELLKILAEQTELQRNFQILLAQQQQVQTSLLEQKTTVEQDSNQLREIDTNLNKPVKKRGFFSWRKR